MPEWTCGPKCRYWSAYTEAHGYNGLCREEHACNVGDECEDTLDEWEDELRGKEAEVAALTAAIAARRAVEVTEGAKERRYGQWAGNPKGAAEDKTRCIESVWSDYVGGQCSRKRGYGKDGLYCKQHAKRYPAAEGGEQG